MSARAIRLICFTFLLLCAASAPAQEGHPAKGTWLGYWGPTTTVQSRIVVVFDHDGTTLTGVLNPGPNAVPLKVARLDITPGKPSPGKGVPPVLPIFGVYFEADAKDAKGNPVAIVADPQDAPDANAMASSFGDLRSAMRVGQRALRVTRYPYDANVASRLQDLCKTYDVPLLVGTVLAAAVADRIAVLGQSHVMGYCTIQPQLRFGVTTVAPVVAALAEQAWITCRARRLPAPVKTAVPTAACPIRSHSSWIAGPPFSRMAPATPVPSCKSSLAALTTASTSSSVTSPSHKTSWVPSNCKLMSLFSEVSDMGGFPLQTCRSYQERYTTPWYTLPRSC